MLWTSMLMSTGPAMAVGKQARSFIQERDFCFRVLRLNEEEGEFNCQGFVTGQKGDVVN
ncbi:hypothetical protein M758_10G100300 [Ceratodon purpureus]|uniref:Uncharacterized protein n=1 Tax=Ceratodon purpureus TaxID=3225 RepID=A0A8T0GK76_CERPU|nr:hypothetical protein KC19_10G102500 [Ceratodon purpureus]KAG0603526.1 hypothetical protein M758_10G100300 [Ceratodon purpureus]